MNNILKRKRNPFTSEEDKKLRELVDIYGEQNWSVVSSHMLNRSVRQCRDRWTNSLSGNIVKGEWTAEEDALLLKLFKENGSRWKSMEKFFPGRAQYDIRNHCKSIVNQKLYAFSFFSQNNINSSNLKNKTKSSQASKKQPQTVLLRQQIPLPTLVPSCQNNRSAPRNDRNLDCSNLHVNTNLHIQLSPEKISNNSYFYENQTSVKQQSSTTNEQYNSNGANSQNNLANAKPLFNMNKIDPILVPFISENMLLQIPSF